MVNIQTLARKHQSACINVHWGPTLHKPFHETWSASEAIYKFLKTAPQQSMDLIVVPFFKVEILSTFHGAFTQTKLSSY
jgi:hypothetical protein